MDNLKEKQQKKLEEKMPKKKEETQFAQLLDVLNKNLAGMRGGPNSMAQYQQPCVPTWDKFGKRVPPPVVPLPPHLLPTPLGAAGEVLTAAQRRDRLSTFKKIKDGSQVREEAIQ